MNNLPKYLFYGVDIAIKKLRPNASFELNGTNFTSWYDSTGKDAPTWEEVAEQLQHDQTAVDEWLRNNKE